MMIAIAFKSLTVFLVLLCVAASPAPTRISLLDTRDELQKCTTEPYFPDDPKSCGICQKIIFNPGAFVDVIRCACADTFKSVFPQCADCFVKTNQSNVLDAPNLPDVVDGMRKVCALSSALLGNVSSTNNESATTHAPSPTSNAAGASPVSFGPVLPVLAAVTLAVVGGVLAL
ncbi:hypothetical protein HDZ31DRAFT_72770 [Schizophyllum fasciatum]